MSELLKSWPMDPAGEQEEAAHLGREGDFAAQTGILCSLLESCGIPYLKRRPVDGQLGFLYGGFSTVGVDIYVPVSRLEEAKELLNAAAQTAGEEEEKE